MMSFFPPVSSYRVTLGSNRKFMGDKCVCTFLYESTLPEREDIFANHMASSHSPVDACARPPIKYQLKNIMCNVHGHTFVCNAHATNVVNKIQNIRTFRQGNASPWQHNDSCRIRCAPSSSALVLVGYLQPGRHSTGDHPNAHLQSMSTCMPATNNRCFHNNSQKRADCVTNRRHTHQNSRSQLGSVLWRRLIAN